MGKQFKRVNSQYGAPMGRHSAPHLDLAPRSVRLFKVALDSGGYDDGGAYWGHGGTIWAAVDRDGDMQTVRAASRERAAFELDIPNTALVSRMRGWAEYGLALIDGRAPMPAGKDRADVISWLESCGAKMGGKA